MISDTPSCETPMEAPVDLSALFWIYSRKTEDQILKARLCFLTSPERGQLLLNLQMREGEHMQIEINRAQLAGIVLEGARILWERG